MATITYEMHVVCASQSRRVVAINWCEINHLIVYLKYNQIKKRNKRTKKISISKFAIDNHIIWCDMAQLELNAPVWQ